MEAAVEGRADEVAQLLAAGAGTGIANDAVNRGLMLASSTGNAEVVQQLLAAGASVNKPKHDIKMTPLMYVAGNGNEGIVEQLLAAGASVDATDSKSRTALFGAAMNGRCGVVRRLLAAGAAGDAADVGGFTPLMTAASNAHAEVVLLLTEAGAAPNARLKDSGSTALHLAALAKCATTVCFLTAAPGTELDARDGRGRVRCAGCSASQGAGASL
jgi:ankyrin repeat protein